MPPKKRVMKNEVGVLDVAVPIENRPNMNRAGKMEIRRPQISEMGAQHKGPKANPRLTKGKSQSVSMICGGQIQRTHMYKEIPNTPTSLLTPRYAAMVVLAGDMILEPILGAKASIPN